MQLHLLAFAPLLLTLGGCATIYLHPPASLDDQAYTWTETQHAVDKRTPYIVFEKGGNLTGFTGCNLIRGTWTLTQGEMSIPRIATTLKSCPTKVREEEYERIKKLRNVRYVRQDQEKLRFFDMSKDEIMTLSPYNHSFAKPNLELYRLIERHLQDEHLTYGTRTFRPRL